MKIIQNTETTRYYGLGLLTILFFLGASLLANRATASCGGTPFSVDVLVIFSAITGFAFVIKTFLRKVSLLRKMLTVLGLVVCLAVITIETFTICF